MLYKKWSHIAVETSDSCLLSCPACRRPDGHNHMTPETFTKILDRLQTELTTAILSWRGEPTMSPHLPEIAEIATEHGVWTRLATDTCVRRNHHYFNRLLQSLNVLKICVDGYDQESLQKYRVGANWGVLTKNLETISRIGPTPAKKEMCVLMFKHNEGHEDEFREMARKYGMNELQWRKPIINGHMKLTQEEKEEWLADNPTYQRYHKVKGTWVHKSAPIIHKTPPVIATDGTVYGCCSDRYGVKPLGNILTTNPDTIKRRLIKFQVGCTLRAHPFCRDYCWRMSEPMEVCENVL